MSTYILIHGAWHGAWCWEKVIPKLQADNHRVIAPDLPGRFQQTRFVQLADYVDQIVDIINQEKTPVILVGHSMGGIVISQVAEKVPDKIKKLVFLAAFMPLNDESMFDVAALQAPTSFVQYMHSDVHKNSFSLEPMGALAFLYHLCSKDIAQRAVAKLNSEPLAPLATKVKISQTRYGRIERVYIQCTQDRALTWAFQQFLCSRISCLVYQLNSDHSPFYSAVDDLVTTLKLC